MMWHRLGLINKNQKGFTLIELMVAMVIGGLIAAAITATLFQVVIGSARTNNHMTAVRQVQNAGYWVSHDAQMAQNVDTTLLGTQILKLEWTDGEVTYTIEGGELKRQYDGTSTATVARFIDSTTKCQLSGGGDFTLPDKNDTFTISGGAVADSGKITVTSGKISVTTAGGATYSASTGTWTTPAAGGTVTVEANEASTAGVWTSTTASATVAVTADTDGNATITGSRLVFTVTATVRGQTESRVYEVTPRPS